MADESSEVKIGRIDERTAFMQLQTTEIVKHLEKINGAILQNSKDTAQNKTDIAVLQTTQRHDRKLIYWVIGGIVTVAVTIVTSFFKRIGIG